MNSILHLKGTFESKKNNNSPGFPGLPNNGIVTSIHIQELINELTMILKKWKRDTLIEGALISVHYTQVVAKSNRIKEIFKINSQTDSSFSICGSKFEMFDGKINHVFTHYVDLQIIEKAIENLRICNNIILEKFDGKITDDVIKNIIANRKKFQFIDIKLSKFLQLIVDCFYVNRFDIDEDVTELKEEAIITIYKTKLKTSELLRKIGINIPESKILDETTISLLPSELETLKLKAPYLIAMEIKDLSEVSLDDISDTNSNLVSIPAPTNEPTIGVIDTLFYKDVYFGDWVDYIPMINKDILDTTTIDDYKHGTAVTSLIVDGPTINPHLDDGCGRFKVKHFGVATGGRFSSFTILKQIKEIIANNSDIKVWNLSLGSALEIHQNFISPEAAELDKIQCEYDVIFIVAGTNKPQGFNYEMKIGAPADSINSIVVNAVTSDNEPVSYHRVGPVLSFFHKPDVSYYGGDKGEPIRVCTPLGEGYVCGTSFVAPWITRKVAYLIYNMGLTREVAKALIIDSAANWHRQDNMSHSIGYGIVPIKIDDIIKSPSDEIRFIMTGVAEKYETYTYNIPVPSFNDKQPFFAKATLCYFPRCSRNQGVDYTDTEMDIHFGRIRENQKGTKIVDINDNNQDEIGKIGIYEGPARKLYRKWDNIKHISEKITKRKCPRTKYGIGNWGLSIKTKERLTKKIDKEMPFGLVITLKEMYGENRIDDFIKLCMARGWIVNRIDIESRIDIYNKLEEEIHFD